MDNWPIYLIAIELVACFFITCYLAWKTPWNKKPLYPRHKRKVVAIITKRSRGVPPIFDDNDLLLD